MDVKKSGDLLYLLGLTRDELGGSEYFAMLGEIGNSVPKVEARTAIKRYQTINRAQLLGLIASCHDLSEGGLGVALAEIAFAGGLGLRVDLRNVDVEETLRVDHLLFSESASRLLVTVSPRNRSSFEALFESQSCRCIGTVIEEEKLEVIGLDGENLMTSLLADLKEAWQCPLREL